MMIRKPGFIRNLISHLQLVNHKIAWVKFGFCFFNSIFIPESQEYPIRVQFSCLISYRISTPNPSRQTIAFPTPI